VEKLGTHQVELLDHIAQVNVVPPIRLLHQDGNGAAYHRCGIGTV